MFKSKNNKEQSHNHTITSATIQTRATAMGYGCRFFCTCSRDSDVVEPSSSNKRKNQEQSNSVSNVK